MPFPVSISFPAPRDQEPVCPPNVRSSFRERPKGLWRGRVTGKSSNVPDRKESSPHITSSDTEDECAVTATTSTASVPHCRAHHLRPRKRRRTDSSSDCTDESDDVYYWDFARQRSTEPLDHHHQYHYQLEADPQVQITSAASASGGPCRSSWETRTKKIVISSIVQAPPMDQQQQSQQENTKYDFDDWEMLKDLFARAAEHYEGNDSAETLPLLRGVMHECHQFLISYPDPSVLFTKPTPPPTPSVTVERSKGHPRTSSSSSTKEVERKDPKCTCFIELPTAFHALLGTALFLFGNIINQDASLALEGEPTNPVPYWIAALDVFEMGDSLPSRTSGIKSNTLPEDWRMAVVWGRTLVCLAEELINRQSQAKDEGIDPTSVFLDIEEPKWPKESPFYAISTQRQPIMRRMTFDTATPNDLLTLAMDQFSRGIFHMPHPQNVGNRLAPAASSSSASASTPLPTSSPSTSTSSSMFSLPGRGGDDSFSRAKQLYTIAFEVLHVAEKLDSTEERHQWATWADSVLNQMKMEATTAPDMDDVWRSCVLRSRGRCRLIVGSAFAEDVEAALERGELDVLRSEDAENARADLVQAIELFERARAREREKESEKGKEKENKEVDSDQEIEEELTTLMTEALVTLANLTEDPKERDTLYARAKVEAGSDMDLDLDGDDDEAEDDDNDARMDESH